MKILVTGGAGYIGSHTCVELLKNGHDVTAADNFANSDMQAIDGVKKITGKNLEFYETDLRNETELNDIFVQNPFDCVIHFAGLKAVAESVAKPMLYYENNLVATLNLCRAMKNYGVKRIIFSSSATVYKGTNPMPLGEDAELGAINPYGWSKFMCEQILRDTAAAEGDWSVVLLRYFNPVGAHESGIIGENPRGIPNNLMPFIAQTAGGIHAKVNVFGNDYATPDGTGIRDYIHVEDLAKGHVNAMDFAFNNPGCEVFNLGTGRGVSVLEMIETFKKVNKVNVPYEIAARRPGDNAEVFANPAKAAKILGFKAEKNLEDMCRDAWKYFHPPGAETV
ncbi:MAG: UDP-glucose 4-epimerase GalE [Defluviitaleaceae bacterium]|nr:UDP-glucose 4-epimerase GalE [Defluviitaleaceae bacterium]